jgi:hypothetical protein
VKGTEARRSHEEKGEGCGQGLTYQLNLVLVGGEDSGKNDLVTRLLVAEDHKGLLDGQGTTLAADTEADQHVLERVGLDDVGDLLGVGDLVGVVEVLIIEGIDDLDGDIGELGGDDHLDAPHDADGAEDGRVLALGSDGQINRIQALVGLGGEDVEGVEGLVGLAGGGGGLLVVEQDLLLVGGGVDLGDVDVGLRGELAKDVGHAELWEARAKEREERHAVSKQRERITNINTNTNHDATVRLHA